MSAVPVVIVGGGPAGLSAAGALAAAGVRSVVLDQDERIGGSWRRRYERLHLHTVRRYSGLAHFPIPATFPKYLSKDQYADYLTSYAEHFGLLIELNTKVLSIRIDGASTANDPVYVVEGERQTWRCGSVVIATGMYREPTLPALENAEHFRGAILHASRYATGRDHAGKRVLVVGIGNTGAEIAADLVEGGAAFVALSVRTPPTIVPRDVLGRPVQESALILSRLPPNVADAIGTFIARFTVGDLRRYGLGAPGWSPFTDNRVPVIDVGFLENLKAGRIAIRPNIARYSSDGVIFSDGSAEDYDVVIFATGYATGLDTLLDMPGLLNESAYPRFASGTPTSQRGLYFMGFLRSNRGHLYETEIASRNLAAAIAADRRPPPAQSPSALRTAGR